MKRTTEQRISYELSPGEVLAALIEKVNDGNGYPTVNATIRFTENGGAVITSIFPENTEEKKA